MLPFNLSQDLRKLWQKCVGLRKLHKSPKLLHPIEEADADGDVGKKSDSVLVSYGSWYWD